MNRDELNKFYQESFEKHNFRKFDFTKPLYKYMSLDGVKALLKSNSLLFQSASAFNDPFELHLGLFDLNIHKTLRREWAKDAVNQVGGTRADRRKNINKYTRASDFKEMISTSLGYHRNSIGICCFSEVVDNILMWSHYADKHKGVCLGFKLPDITNQLPFGAFRVNYTEDIVPYKIRSTEEIATVLGILNWIFTKSKVWEYEQEVRVINFEKKGLIRFPSEHLIEIHYGVSTTSHDIAAIEEILLQRKYNIQYHGKMEIAKDAFRLSTKKL